MYNDKALTIRSVADGNKLMLEYPDDDNRTFGLRHKAWGVSAARINKIEGWLHYRVAKVAALRTIVIIAERRKEDGTNED